MAASSTNLRAPAHSAALHVASAIKWCAKYNGALYIMVYFIMVHHLMVPVFLGSGALDLRAGERHLHLLRARGVPLQRDQRAPAVVRREPLDRAVGLDADVLRAGHLTGGGPSLPNPFEGLIRTLRNAFGTRNAASRPIPFGI